MGIYEKREIKWLIDKPRGLFLTRRSGTLRRAGGIIINKLKNVFIMNKLIISFTVLLLSFLFCQCAMDANDDSNNNIDMSKIDFSNIDSLYAQPLTVIQKCVEGKWKWYVSYGGIAGANYSDNTFIDIKEDHYVIDYEDGSQRTWYFTWEKYTATRIGHETYAMWNKTLNTADWYFVSIKNDTLTVYADLPPGSVDVPFAFGFVRVK